MRVSTELKHNQGLNLPAIREFRLLISEHKRLDAEHKDDQNYSKSIMIQLNKLLHEIQDLLSSCSRSKSYEATYQESQASTNLKGVDGRSRQIQNSRFQQKTYSDIQHSTPVKHKKTVLERNTPFDDLNDKQGLGIGEDQQGQGAETLELQKQNKKLLNKLVDIQLRYQEVSKEKDYCIQLLNKSTVKDSDLEIELRCLRNQTKELTDTVRALEEQNRNLIQCDQEKSILLKDIDQFFTSNESKTGSRNKMGSSRGNENERLISEIIEYQQEISRLTKQIDTLSAIQSNNEQQISNLVNSHEEVLATLSRYQSEINQLKFKNQELINIEQSKKLNEIVHKENKHLLQLNYELGNKIYGYEKEIEQLIIRVVELEGDGKRGGVETSTNEGISASPSANKGICIDQMPSLTKTKSMSDLKHSSAKNTIHNLNIRLRNQTEINTQLQGKIEDLLDQLYVCQKSIFEKEKELANMSLSFNRSDIMPPLTTNAIESREKESQDQIPIQDLVVEKDEVLTLEEFVFKFQPSLMDTLFIMLRITEIAVVMLEEGYARTIIPAELLLQLDDPNKPQNIIVQLKSNDNEEDIETAQVFVSREILEGEEFSESAVVWNLGMIFYYLLCKEPYFKNVEELRQLDEIRFKSNLLPEVSELVKDTLKMDSESRITLDQLLQGISQEINKIFSEY